MNKSLSTTVLQTFNAFGKIGEMVFELTAGICEKTMKSKNTPDLVAYLQQESPSLG